MQRVAHLVETYGRLAGAVLLVGPTGVGKGLIAQLLHQKWGRAGSFVALTGGALTDSLHHTQLFGHERGAFTDAKSRVRGAFEQAAGGTLFLDELPHWSRAAQSSLLRPLSEGWFRPVGAEREITVTCRLIFASTRPLDTLVAEGILLEDLRWRIPHFEIHIPALADRRADILPLADRFLCRGNRGGELDHVKEFSSEVLRALLGHSWPGNVRELMNEIEVAVVHAAGAGRVRIELEDLTPSVARVNVTVSDFPEETLRGAIRWALRHTGGNGLAAARLLGIHRNTVSRRRSDRFPVLSGPDDASEAEPEKLPVPAA